MLTVTNLAQRAYAQRLRCAASGEALDVRWGKALAALVPAGSPSVVTEHLAGALMVHDKITLKVWICCGLVPGSRASNQQIYVRKSWGLIYRFESRLGQHRLSSYLLLLLHVIQART